MTSTAHVWDKTVLRGNEWLTALGRDLGCHNVHLSLYVMRSVLHVLRDRLPPDEAVELAAQMPLIIKGLYFDGWDPSRTPVPARTKEEFLSLVAQRLQRGLPDADPEELTRAVFRLIAERVSPGDIRDLLRVLPAEIADMWPATLKDA